MEITEQNFEEMLSNIENEFLIPSIVLLPFGLVFRKHIEKHNQWNNVNIKSINTLIQDIPKYFQKHSKEGKKYWNTSSYGAKHHVEEMRRNEEYQGNPYCSNGEFIFAMLYLGYEMKSLNTNFSKYNVLKKDKITNEYIPHILNFHPNATFNASSRNLKKDICECGLEYTYQSKKQHQKTKIHQAIMREKQKNN
jgi:hypothetical protein